MGMRCLAEDARRDAHDEQRRDGRCDDTAEDEHRDELEPQRGRRVWLGTVGESDARANEAKHGCNRDEELGRRDGADHARRREPVIGEQAGRGDGAPAAAASRVDEASREAKRDEQRKRRRAWPALRRLGAVESVEYVRACAGRAS